MDHRERFYRTINRECVDRPASWLGLPMPEAHAGLFRHFGVASVDELKRRLDDDIHPVELPYHSPVSNAIYMAFNFARQGQLSEDKRTLTAPGFFADRSDPARVDEFDWPDPEKYIDPAECRAVVGAAPEDYAVLGVVWSANFQDACAAFGMENALLAMMANPEMFQAVLARITDFYLRANEIFYQATRGRLDAVLIGNDFGCQTGLMLSAELIRRNVWPWARKLIDQAKAHGLKVIYHSCGSISELIPDLIEMGVDAIHPIQALARDMDARKLHKAYGGRISFCGGVDAQEMLVGGTPAEVRAKVAELKSLFPTGLILSPSHEAILADTRPENIEALFDEARRVPVTA